MRLDFEWGCIAGVDVVNEADLTAMLKYPHNEVLDAECYAGRFADVFEKYCSKRGRLGCDIEGIITYYLDVGKSAGLAGQYLEDSESQDERRDVWGCALFDQNKEEKEAECYAKRYPKVIPKYCKNNDPTKCDLEELKKHKERHENNVWGCSSKNGDTQTANLDEEVDIVAVEEELTVEKIWNRLSNEQQEELALNALCYIQNYPPDQLFQVSNMNPPCLDRDPNFCNPVRLYFYHVSDGISLGFQWGCIAGKNKLVREQELNAMIKYPHNEVLNAECYAGRFQDIFLKYCRKGDEYDRCDIEGIIAYYLEWGESEGLAEFYLGDSEPLDQRRGVWGCDLPSENEKNDDASNEAKEAECYAKRYPKVIPKYCKDNDATKCDLEQLKKHNERHEKNVWGCSSGEEENNKLPDDFVSVEELLEHHGVIDYESELGFFDTENNVAKSGGFFSDHDGYDGDDEFYDKFFSIGNSAEIPGKGGPIFAGEENQMYSFESSLDGGSPSRSNSREHSIVDFIALSAIIVAFLIYFRNRSNDAKRAEQIKGYTPMGRNRREF
uniref:Uncharacterized protein n=1 Tax=Ditylum brightwellii TaxID=49249 RepID=A0A7S1YZA4_9STRA|mmetsp:Transcript_21092/g.31326  ORF Transcript_21092/g.31326 Transcript_21092/m.31326 type:complete len:553 (+) Transcript_21092:1-1659(+)